MFYTLNKKTTTLIYMTTTLENQIMNQLKKEAFDSFDLEILERTTVKVTKVIGQLVFFLTSVKSKINGDICECGAFMCDTTTTGKVKSRTIRTDFQYAN